MKKTRRNSSWVFASFMLAILALSALINANSLSYSFDVSLDSATELTAESEDVFRDQSVSFLDNESSASAVLTSRRPYQQMQFRPQRGAATHGFLGRDVISFERAASHVLHISLASLNKFSGYPSASAYRSAKEYYVYTLKRILC